MNLLPHEIAYVAGDTLPSFRGTLSNDDGTPYDLSGCTVTMHIKYGTVLKKTASLLDAQQGKFLVEWLPTDLRAGKWLYEIQIEDGSGGIITFNRLPANGRNLTLAIDPQIA